MAYELFFNNLFYISFINFSFFDKISMAEPTKSKCLPNYINKYLLQHWTNIAKKPFNSLVSECQMYPFCYIHTKYSIIKLYFLWRKNIENLSNNVFWKLNNLFCLFDLYFGYYSNNLGCILQNIFFQFFLEIER